MLNCLLAVTDELSVTCTVNVKLPELVGVPLIAPLAASSASPAGSAPAVIDQ
jgi:hypothetical protein